MIRLADDFTRHNLVSDHSAQHSYYTEALVIQYFGRIANKIASSSQAATLPSDPLQPNPSLMDID